MKRLIAAVCIAGLAACAAGPTETETITKTKNKKTTTTTTRTTVRVEGGEEVKRVMLPRSATWEVVGEDSVLLQANGRYYLLDLAGHIDLERADNRVMGMQDDGYLEALADSVMVGGHSLLVESILHISAESAEDLRKAMRR